jgi:hypothetical protein
VKPPLASIPVTIPIPPGPSDTREVFPQILHVIRPGWYIHHGWPTRSPQNGQLSRGIPGPELTLRLSNDVAFSGGAEPRPLQRLVGHLLADR